MLLSLVVSGFTICGKCRKKAGRGDDCRSTLLGGGALVFPESLDLLIDVLLVLDHHDRRSLEDGQKSECLRGGMAASF
ncbi:hypothetical protein [Caballeronia pedi]|uniref:hypothetical protein n=1 Tax=Caballeronia pedi TaxID=1777141 RepID=UPI0011785A9A|nr:hypothetical protein [Caballeronia pedi]